MLSWALLVKVGTAWRWICYSCCPMYSAGSLGQDSHGSWSHLEPLSKVVYVGIFAHHTQFWKWLLRSSPALNGWILNDIDGYWWSLHQMPAPDSWATLGWVKLAKCHRDRTGILPISLAVLAFIHHWQVKTGVMSWCWSMSAQAGRYVCWLVQFVCWNVWRLTAYTLQVTVGEKSLVHSRNIGNSGSICCLAKYFYRGSFSESRFSAPEESLEF